MKKTNAVLSRPVLAALIVVLVASACISTLPAPVSAPALLATPDLVRTRVAQTLTAAPPVPATATQLLPTPTSSITLTPFPSITPLPTSTPTGTETPFGFFASHTPTITNTPTPIETKDPAEGATTDWGSDYRCSIIEKSPPNWTEVPPNGRLRVSWTLLNSGHETWQPDSMQLKFVEGANMNGPVKIFQLPRNVKPGQQVTVFATIYPPKEPGFYRSVWGLLSLKGAANMFCTFTVKISVVKK